MPYTVNCARCGVEFEARNTRARYCKDACRAAAYRVRSAGRLADLQRRVDALEAAQNGC